MAAAKVGRTWQSPIWDFFEYDDEKDKSKCLVVETDKREREATSRPGSTGKDTTIMDCFHRRPNSCWLVNLQEHHNRKDALVNMFTETGMSTRLCDPIAFKEFCT